MEGICGLISFDNTLERPSQMIDEMASALSDGESLSVSKVTGSNWALACTNWKEDHWQPKTFAHQDEKLAIVGIADIHNLHYIARQHNISVENVGAVVAAIFRSDPEKWALQIRGTFSIIIIENETERFVAATDRIGIRPLYWHRQGNVYYLCSRLGGVRCVCRSLEIDDGAIYAYMHHSMIPSPYTIYKNVQKLEPGFLLKADARRHTLVQYWDITNMPKLSESEDEIAERVYGCIDGAVSVIKEGVAKEGKLACFLSGGTDSSSICGLLSRSSNAPIGAYSVGFSETDYNEMFYANTAAKEFSLTHNVRYLQPKDVIDLLPYIVRAYDEPFGNSSAIPVLYCVRSAACDGVLHMFAGDGGDEIFAGNQRYARQQLFRDYYKIPRTVRNYILEPLLMNRLERLPCWFFRKAGSYVRRAKMCDIDRIYSYRYATDKEMFDPIFLSRCNSESMASIPRKHFSRLPDATPLDRHLYLDMKLTATDNDLRKVTRMCEVAHVRVRYPMLDYPVIDLGFLIPADLKLKGTKNLRYIFKRAFLDLLPQEILKKRKQGFGIPIAAWLRTDRRIREFASKLLFDKRHLDRGYFNPGFVRKLWNMNLNDRRGIYGSMVWDLVMLEAWHLEHLDNEPLLL
jgi:asparagine synthase (glutamine-hydrolysing)